MKKARKGNAPVPPHAKQSGKQVSHAGFAHPKNNVDALDLQKGMNVADFGSGSGAYALAMAEVLAESGRVYVIDIQKDLLRRTQNEALKRGLKNLEILWADLEAPGGSKIADGALELVLVSNLLFQIEDKAAVIAEAKRVLRAGGRLVIIDWEESFGGMGPHPEDVVAKKKAYGLAHDAGLTYMRDFPAGAHHYGLIFRKGK